MLALACDVARQLNARNAVDGFRQIVVGEFADILGENGIGEVRGALFCFRRFLQAGGIAGDGYFLDPVQGGGAGRGLGKLSGFNFF